MLRSSLGLDRLFLEVVLRLWSVLIRPWVLIPLTTWFQAGSGLVGLVLLVLAWFQTGLDWFCAALWFVVKQTVGACPLGGVVPDWFGLVYL